MIGIDVVDLHDPLLKKGRRALQLITHKMMNGIDLVAPLLVAMGHYGGYIQGLL